MPKISAKKLILWELLSLNSEHKNSIKRKRLWVWQIFMDRNSKGEFHVLVKELKLFDHEFFFKHIATRHFDFSQRCFSVYILLNNLLDSAILLGDNTIEQFIPLWSWIFFNSKTEKKKFPVQGNEIIAFLVGALAQS